MPTSSSHPSSSRTSSRATTTTTKGVLLTLDARRCRPSCRTCSRSSPSPGVVAVVDSVVAGAIAGIAALGLGLGTGWSLALGGIGFVLIADRVRPWRAGWTIAGTRAASSSASRRPPDTRRAVSFGHGLPRRPGTARAPAERAHGTAARADPDLHRRLRPARTARAGRRAGSSSSPASPTSSTASSRGAGTSSRASASSPIRSPTG